MLRCLLAFVSLTIFPFASEAQRVATSVDAGGISLRAADSVTSTAAYISSALSSQVRGLALRGRAGLSQFSGGGWYAQGHFSASLYSPRMGPLLGELGGSYSGSVFKGGSTTGDARSSVRAHLMASSAGVWLGGGAARSWNQALSNPVLFGDAGVWMRAGLFSAALSTAPYSVADTVRYLDSNLFLQFESSLLQVAAGAGVRSGDELPSLAAGARKNWWNLSGTLRISRMLALAGAIGTYPVDYAQGFPGGRYASVGIRLPSRFGQSAAAPVEDPERVLAAESGITKFSIRQVRDSIYEMRVESGADSIIELAGDFTSWQPVAMQRTSARGRVWVYSMSLRPGEYQMNVRLKGGQWIVPPTLMIVRDEFGGAAGLLIIK